MRQLYAQTSMRLVTQNVRGLTPEKLKMIIHTMKDRGIHAAALQETWAAVPSEARGELVRKDREGRVMTVNLALEGQRTLQLDSAYSSTTVTSSDERQACYDEMTRCAAGGEPRANTADIGLQKEGFYSDPSDACCIARGA